MAAQSGLQSPSGLDQTPARHHLRTTPSVEQPLALAHGRPQYPRPHPRHFRPHSHPLYRQLPTLMSSTASTGMSGAAPSTSPPTATGRSSPVNPRHRRRRSMGTSLAPSTSSAWCVDSCGVYGNGLLAEDFVAKWGRPYFDVNKQQQGPHGRRSRRQFSKAMVIAEMAGMGRRAPQAVLPTI